MLPSSHILATSLLWSVCAISPRILFASSAAVGFEAFFVWWGGNTPSLTVSGGSGRFGITGTRGGPVTTGFSLRLGAGAGGALGAAIVGAAGDGVTDAGRFQSEKAPFSWQTEWTH